VTDSSQEVSPAVHSKVHLLYLQLYSKRKMLTVGINQGSKQQQQQQQHSLLSQASWGRLEMKPKRDEKQEDT
jgi:hypothetical protein